MKLVLASGNQGKLAELDRLLAPLGHQLVSQRELGIDSPEESGSTYVENAIIKARHAAAHARLPAIADDSGISVDALGGAPGVHSARFAGADATDADNNRKLLAELEHHPGSRAAGYHCVLVLMRTADDPVPLITQGSWRGAILRRPRGDGGFGYDPLFYDARYSMTGAEMSPELKNSLSHRGQAVRALLAALAGR